MLHPLLSTPALVNACGDVARLELRRLVYASWTQTVSVDVHDMGVTHVLVVACPVVAEPVLSTKYGQVLGAARMLACNTASCGTL